MRVVERVPTSRRVLDRVPLNERTLEIANHLRAGGSVPPIHCLHLHGWLVVLNGRHRAAAYRMLRRPALVKYWRPA